MKGYDLWGALRLHNGDTAVRCYLHGEDGDKIEVLVEGALDANDAVLAAQDFLEEEQGQSYGCDEWVAA